MADFKATTQSNNETYVHWAVVTAIVVFVIAVCCWGLGPASWRRLLGYEGFNGTSFSIQSGMMPSRRLASQIARNSNTSAHQNVLAQGNPLLQGSVSTYPQYEDGAVKLAGDGSFQQVTNPTASFLGGPQAPLFSGPPGATHLTSHQYPEASNLALQASLLGMNPEDVINNVNSFRGGREGLVGGRVGTMEPIFLGGTMAPASNTYYSDSRTGLRDFPLQSLL